MKLTLIHPAVYTCYYTILMIFAFLFNDPYYILSFLICITVLVALQGINKEFKNVIKIFIPMSLLIILLNPLTSKNGATRIYLWGNQFITLEAVAYGILMSMALLIILLLFASYNRSVSYQEMLYVLSKKFPNISMVIVMAMRFIPLLSYRLNEVNKVFRFEHQNSDAESRTRMDKIKEKAQEMAVVVSWSLEEAMMTAKSMKARGYGITERTSYLSYKFRRTDKIFVLIIMVTAALSVMGLFLGYGRINVYPKINFSFHENPLNIYYASFLIFLLPLIYLELKERLIWQ